MSDKITGKEYAMILHTFGIKFKKNIIIAQNKAKSSQKSTINKYAILAVVKLTIVFIRK